MKQVLTLRGGTRIVREVPPPACQPGGVLVRTAFSVISPGTEGGSSGGGASGSVASKALSRPDLARGVVVQAAQDGIKQTRTSVRRRLGETWAAGYSSAGTVLEVGAAVSGLSPGDPVACGGVGYANHAEVVAVPGNLCASVPPGVTLQTAALTTIATVALHGIRLADVRIGDRTAVIGCGLIGQISARLLRAAGSEVFVLDLDESRAAHAGGDHAFAAGPGAAPAVLAATGGLGVDHVLVTAASSSNDPLLLAAEIARDRAELVVVGDVQLSVPRSALFTKELSLRVSRSYGPGRYDGDYERHGVDYPIGYVRWTEQRNMECVLDLQARGRLDLSDLIEEVVPVDQAPAAYKRVSGPPSHRARGAIAIAYPAREEGFGTRATGTAASTGALGTARGVGIPGAVRIGLIGPGHFATSQIVPALIDAGAELAVVGGGAGRSAESAARGFGFARLAHSEDAVIADPGVDAVVVCTRHASHAALSMRALEAGKHVFCEKPLVLTVGELELVMDAARGSGRVLAVGFNRRFAPLAVELRSFLRTAGSPVTVSYRIGAGAIPAGNWVHDLGEGGGRILGELCHFLDTLVFLADSPVLEVHASGFSNLDLPAQARDNVAVTLRHANGSLGTIVYVAQSAPGVSKERVEAFGPGGIGVLDDFRSLYLHGRETQRVGSRRQDKGHRAELAAFIAAVRSGVPPVPLPAVANVSLATLAVVESIRTGGRVRLADSAGSVS
jgi:predicted dehydrogenase/threonine dehydrogenase-like Zn-dependent dehydrogenase